MEDMIGFILLTHKNPQQVIRLTRTLQLLFGNPRIAIHHDQSKSSLALDQGKPSNIKIVKNHCLTSWGKFSLIDGTMKAISLMESKLGLPKWVFFISEGCYPIKTRECFYEYLETARNDAYIHHELIDINNIKRSWNKQCWDRYCSGNESPFNALFPCYAGSQWFHANKKTIRYLINYYNRNPLLSQYYVKQEQHRLIVPDESYYQTVLANNFSLSLSQDHKRFIDWEGQGSHPRTLGIQDLDILINSDKLIARKFDISQDEKILNALDSHLGIQ